MCCTCQYGMELLVVEWIAFVYRAGQILKQIPQAAIAGSVLLITLLNGRGRRGVRGRSSRAVGVVLAVTAERATKLAPAVVSNLLVDGRTADGTDILRDRRGGLCRGRGLSRSSGAVGIGLTGPAKDSAELTLTVVSNLLVNGSATAGADETVLDRLLRSVLLGRSLLRGCLIRSRTSRCRGCGSCIRDIAFSMRSIPTGRNLLVALGICSLLSGSVALVLLSGSVALILLRSRIVTLLRRCGLAIAVAVVGIPVAVILALAAVKEDEVIGAVALQIAVGISLVGGAFLFFKAVDHDLNIVAFLETHPLDVIAAVAGIDSLEGHLMVGTDEVFAEVTTDLAVRDVCPDSDATGLLLTVGQLSGEEVHAIHEAGGDNHKLIQCRVRVRNIDLSVAVVDLLLIVVAVAVVVIAVSHCVFLLFN